MDVGVHNTADKKAAKHMYMSLNKDKTSQRDANREHSVSSDNRYYKHSYTGGKTRENN